MLELTSTASRLSVGPATSRLAAESVVRRTAACEFGHRTHLHLGVGPLGRLATLDNALDSHAMFTLTRAAAADVIGQMWTVVREWRTAFERVGVCAEAIDKTASAFRHIDDVSTSALRKLLH